jgi:hypothetical protein
MTLELMDQFAEKPQRQNKANIPAYMAKRIRILCGSTSG